MSVLLAARAGLYNGGHQFPAAPVPGSSPMEAITVTCSSCQHLMRFGQDKAGRKAKCPKCGTLVVITAAEAEDDDEEVEETPPPLPEPTKAPAQDDLGAYGATDVLGEEDKNKEPEKKAKGKKKKAPKIARKVRAIPDAEQWEKVRAGLLFIFIGVVLWGGAHLLQGVYVAIGVVDYTEFVRPLAEELNARQNPLPEGGGFWEINGLNVLLSMIAGHGFLGLAKTCLILAVILRLAQPVVSCVGYAICLAVPQRYGTTFQASLLLALGGWNTMVILALLVLPVLGVYSYYLVPLLTPEIAMTEYNMERSVPINVLWLTSPFWECLLNIFIQLLLYLEPIVGAVFIWSIGLSVKEAKIEQGGQSLAQLGLGQFSILLSYHMISVAGTTPVLVTVLRCLYVLWYAFLLLFILSYAGLLLKTREVLYMKINPMHEAE
jgi:hypothetical protein